jgi:hypothetical protein
LIRAIFLFLLLALCFTDTTYSQERYFYHGLPYGSESVYNPFQLILNGSYDVLQFDGMPRNLSYYPYKHAAREVFKNLADPFGPINRFGWKNFIQQEVLLFNFSPKKSQGWPNYNLHLIGGGMTYVAMSEWYETVGFEYPKIASAVTVGVQHFLNEVVESGYFSGDNVDPIADVYIFDLGGILLFSNDNVKNFFGNTLNLRDWSMQPMFSAVDGTLRNNGQYFSMKWKWFGNERWHAFYYFGLEGLGGVSYTFIDGTALSGGVGLRGKNRNIIDEKNNRFGIEMEWNVGMFYDRNNSLLASLFLSGSLNDMVTINIYPGVFNIFGFSPGAALILDNKLRPTFGLTFTYVPGIAFTH